MSNFGDDAIYVWSITIIGLVLPAFMVAFSLLRVHLSKARLKRMKKQAD
ncbi:MAG: hypothetical protein VX599_03530 [Pseudomonadota bacterium]|nr:hypothetical protein [Pseudomonadota bacterium]